jgi:hypothetical protein
MFKGGAAPSLQSTSLAAGVDIAASVARTGVDAFAEEASGGALSRWRGARVVARAAIATGLEVLGSHRPNEHR